MRRNWWVLCLSLLLVVTFAGVAKAEVEINQLGTVFDKFTLGGEWHTFYRFDQKPWFGAPLAGGEENTNYGEILGKIFFTAYKDIGWANVEAKFAPYYVATIGQDFYGFFKDTSDFDLDLGYIKFGKIFDSCWDLTIGRQELHIEKWFVVGDGELQEAGAWLAFHTAFPFAFRLDGDYGAFKPTIFWAKSKRYWQNFEEMDPNLVTSTGEYGKNDVDLFGINLHFDIAENAYVYAGYFRKQDDNPVDVPYYDTDWATLVGTASSENNTDCFDIGFDVTFGGFNFETEWALQKGDAGSFDGDDRDRDALGGFVSAQYTFPVKYSPWIRAYYITFSGDDDPFDEDAEDYDPMFFQFPDWNRWVIGELVGEAQLTNTNKNVTILEVGFSPIETVWFSLYYLRHELEEPYVGVPYAGRFALENDEWADEIYFSCDWLASDNLLISLMAGMCKPDDAAEEFVTKAAGTGETFDDTALYGQLWFMFMF